MDKADNIESWQDLEEVIMQIHEDIRTSNEGQRDVLS